MRDFWRGDAWLKTRIGRTAPPLAPLGADLARMGVTGMTDASATTDADTADLLARAVRAYAVGPVKILLDDHDLPPFDEMIERIGDARRQNRAAAVHCVTAGELALTLAAFDAAGSAPGDRVEHGGLIPHEAIPVLARLGLTVVTQPSFVF